MYCNISTYKFITLSNEILLQLQSDLRNEAIKNNIKGTILLSEEGINLFVAGPIENIKKFQGYFLSNPYFKDLEYKNSYSQFCPFKRLVVKIKKEIITFNVPHIDPEKKPAPYITPSELKKWLEEKRHFVLLDTRNAFEVEEGSFENAIHLHIENFRDFPEAIKNLSESLKNIPIVTFCTGGIRCEKAAPYLLANGFKNVYQLKGGILKYLEVCGNDYYQGNCFVFDDRISLNDRLEPVLSTE